MLAGLLRSSKGDPSEVLLGQDQAVDGPVHRGSYRLWRRLDDLAQPVRPAPDNRARAAAACPELRRCFVASRWG